MSAEEHSGAQSVLQYDEGNCFEDSMKECNGMALLFRCAWTNNKPSNNTYWMQTEQTTQNK